MTNHQKLFQPVPSVQPNQSNQPNQPNQPIPSYQPSQPSQTTPADDTTNADCALLSFQKDQAGILSATTSLQVASGQLTPALWLLDGKGDSLLSIQEQRELSRLHRDRMPMMRARNRLEHSLAAINEAVSQIASLTPCAQQNEYFNRLQGHQADGKAIMELLANFKAEFSSDATLARQELIAMHHFDIAALCNDVKALRLAYSEKALPDYLSAELLHVEIDLLSLQSQLAQWQHSQHSMARQFEVWTEDLSRVKVTMEKLRNNTLFECQERGHRFGNRAGPVTYSKIS